MPEGTNCPTVSILVPVRNEEKSISETLTRLIRQTYPLAKMEILVVDGDSEDRTREIAESFPAAGAPIRILRNPKKNVYAALNIGLTAARNEIILRVDGRSFCPPDYVERCVTMLLRTGADSVGGLQRPCGIGSSQRAIALAMSHPFGAGQAAHRVGKESGFTDSVYLGCFRRELISRVGLIDEEHSVISEDADFNQRIRDAGGRLYFTPDIVVEYRPRETISDLARIYFVWGRARASFVLKHRRFNAWRQFLPPAFLLWVVTTGLLSPFHGVFFLFFLSAVTAYILTTLWCSCSLAIKERDMVLLGLLPAVFPTMHFAWGLGFLKEIIAPSKKVQTWR